MMRRALYQVRKPIGSRYGPVTLLTFGAASITKRMQAKISHCISARRNGRTWCELMLEAVSALSLREVAFRRAVPLGFETGRFDHAQAEKEFCKLAQLMVESMNFEETANAFKREFSRTRHSVMRHQLLQITRSIIYPPRLLSSHVMKRQIL